MDVYICVWIKSDEGKASVDVNGDFDRESVESDDFANNNANEITDDLGSFKLLKMMQLIIMQLMVMQH